jgi:3-keto-L-gulonate-6-phosphate decarboxylase
MAVFDSGGIIARSKQKRQYSVADMKTIDVGAVEAEMAARR